MSLRYELRVLELRTRDTFTISRGGADLWPNLFLRLELDGVEGVGEGAPRAYYGETVQQGTEALRAWLDGRDRLDEADAEALLSSFEGPDSARAALDVALHDLWARRRGLSVSDYLAEAHGLEPGPSPRTSFTIGLDDLDRMIEKVREAAGFPILKVKLGTDRDLEILRAVRSATEAELRVDANAAWSVEETLEKAPRLRDLGVSMLEQPLARDDLAGYRRLHGRLPLPVYADESCKRLADVAGLVGAVDGINIKLGKCGGLHEACRMVSAARSGGLGLMVGCFIESSVGVTAGAALAPFVDLLDLDGAALLAEDPFAGLEIPEGRICAPPGPGLGVYPRNA